MQTQLCSHILLQHLFFFIFCPFVFVYVQTGSLYIISITVCFNKSALSGQFCWKSWDKYCMFLFILTAQWYGFCFTLRCLIFFWESLFHRHFLVNCKCADWNVNATWIQLNRGDDCGLLDGDHWGGQKKNNLSAKNLLAYQIVMAYYTARESKVPRLLLV